MLNVGLVGLVVSLSTTLTIYHAYSIKQQFFPVLSSFTLYVMFLAAYAMKTILFGGLRLIESEHLQEYGWLTVSESFLAMTIFRDEFDARFVLIFSAVLFIKAFHWIARDRIDYMEQTPLLPRKFHARMVATIAILTFADILGLYSCVKDVLKNGPSMAILFVSLTSIVVRYTLNSGDVRRGNAWEHRSIFLFYYEFVVDLLKLIIYSCFFGIVVAYYGVPLHIIRDLYLTIRSFIIRVRDIIRYRQATANMNERYPAATEEELAATDRTCIICREEMLLARKLPCGHLFHFRCLRSWLERQQACPTCRRPILEALNNTRPDIQQQAREQADEHNQPRMIWRNGRWEGGVGNRLVIGGEGFDNEGGDAFNVPLNPDLREGPDLAGGGNAGPVVVFPQLQPANTPVGQIPGTVIPSPFGTIPVILIPPEQIAVVPPPRPARTPDLHPTTVRDDQAVPRRPHSASPIPISSSTIPAHDGKPLYILRSGKQNDPIILESIGPGFPSTLGATDLSRPPNSETKRVVNEEIITLRTSIRSQLRRELATLVQLQYDLATLTERIIQTQEKLSSFDHEEEIDHHVGFEPNSEAKIDEEDDDSDSESSILLGKRKAK